MEAVSPRRPRLAWLVTLAATAASTYALDAVATAAGVLLVASGALGAAGHTAVLAFLAGANLGAAFYEYGLSRLTLVFLRRPR